MVLCQATLRKKYIIIQFNVFIFPYLQTHFNPDFNEFDQCTTMTINKMQNSGVKLILFPEQSSLLISKLQVMAFW
jgi:hypothetical protein